MPEGTKCSMRIAIVDDEKQWRKMALRELHRYYGDSKAVIDMFASGEQLLKAQEGYDVVFLDVEMKGIDGFETAVSYKAHYSEVILVMFTTHTEFSRRGYLVDAFRYIDKMNMENEIPEALASIDKLSARNQTISLHIVNLGSVPFVLKDILYLETEKRNVRVHTRTADYISSDGIGDLEKMLEPYGFYGCHKSYIVNLDAVKSFDHVNVYMIDGSSAMVSSRRYAELKRRYLERKMEYACS